MAADPPVRDDGCCIVCEKPRTITKQVRRYAGVQIDSDPFCSSRCCREWHGTALPGVHHEGRERAGQQAADFYRSQRRYVHNDEAA